MIVFLMLIKSFIYWSGKEIRDQKLKYVACLKNFICILCEVHSNVLASCWYLHFLGGQICFTLHLLSNFKFSVNVIILQKRTKCSLFALILHSPEKWNWCTCTEFWCTSSGLDNIQNVSLCTVDLFHFTESRKKKALAASYSFYPFLDL